jgi:hypothetical protein
MLEVAKLIRSFRYIKGVCQRQKDQVRQSIEGRLTVNLKMLHRTIVTPMPGALRNPCRSGMLRRNMMR